MKLTKVNTLPTTRDMLSAFGGYNHNLKINEGEFYDMQNLSSADYPVLSPRPKRGNYNKIADAWYATKISAIASKDGLYKVTEGGAILKDGTQIGSINNAENLESRTIVSMGAYLIVFPEKYYVNTVSGDADFLEKTYVFEGTTSNSAILSLSPCKIDGSEITEGMDASYVKIRFYQKTGITTSGFEVGDGVTISGINADSLEITDAEKSNIHDLNTTTVIQAIGIDYKDNTGGNGYIVVKGNIEKEYSIKDAKVTVERKLPEMDFVVEANNRLWGCKYGKLENGETVNEIYASKLGDPKNWYCFDGISTDSYTASVGSDGEFTGAITYMGHPIFFKENCMHKVYGNFPSNFQIQTTACRGVQKGCSKSLAILNETLLYKSRSAVCAYDGSLPVEVSQALGDVSYSDAAAGVLGNKYYISMKDSKDYSLFVYDTAKGMWHREDDIHASSFCTVGNNLYFVDADAQINPIKMVRPDTNADEEADPVKWSAVTGIIGTDSPDKKYISNISVRMLIDVGATVRFSAEYDSSGEYEHLYTKTGDKLCSFSIPLKTRRCDHLRLKIEGKGAAKIFSICKTIVQGSSV